MDDNIVNSQVPGFLHQPGSKTPVLAIPFEHSAMFFDNFGLPGHLVDDCFDSFLVNPGFYLARAIEPEIVVALASRK